MTPSEFEENARIISGDPLWSLTGDDPFINPRQSSALAEVGGPLPALCWAVLTLPEWSFDELDDED
tara:strand:- start:237 stop:434 length:198 start_codon:yes stop_codon:yes gene_type:complete